MIQLGIWNNEGQYYYNPHFWVNVAGFVGGTSMKGSMCSIRACVLLMMNWFTQAMA